MGAVRPPGPDCSTPPSIISNPITSGFPKTISNFYFWEKFVPDRPILFRFRFINTHDASPLLPLADNRL
jgi:hypothetical protein